MTKIPMTKRGYEHLKKELTSLRNQRPDMLVSVAWTRSLGETPENLEYQRSQKELRLLENRITELEEKLAQAEVNTPGTMVDQKIIKFGAIVPKNPRIAFKGLRRCTDTL